jgi:mannosyltransferase OCH1-like enzyme
MTTWQKENPERMREIRRRWRKKNPDKSRACTLRWQKENPERMKEHRAKYYYRNRAALLADRCANSILRDPVKMRKAVQRAKRFLANRAQ